MAGDISPQKVTKILSLYFQGHAQSAIAKSVRVNQATVSRYCTRFADRVDEVGLATAAEEYGVVYEVESLRALATELAKNDLLAEDAKEGAKIINTFIKLGVPRSKHVALVKVCKSIEEPRFVKAALELIRLQEKTGLSYDEIVSFFENLESEVETLEGKLQHLESVVDGTEMHLSKMAKEASDLDKERTRLRNEVRSEKERLEAELKNRKREHGVKSAEVEKVAWLQRELSRLGLDLPTLLKLAEEFRVAKRKVDGVALKEALEERGSLRGANEALREKKQSLQRERDELAKLRNAEERERQHLSSKLPNLRRRARRAEEKCKETEARKAISQRQWDLFESLIGMMITSPSTDTSIEELASWVEKLAEKGWYTSKEAEDFRSSFVQAVLGDYLRCFRCKSCGAKFIVNRESQRAWGKYQCPACASLLDVEADDSFVEAMLSEEQMKTVLTTRGLHDEVERLKPVEVFLDIPCVVCGRPLPNIWTRERVIDISARQQLAHPQCWKTPRGQALEMKGTAEALTRFGDILRQLQ